MGEGGALERERAGALQATRGVGPPATSLICAGCGEGPSVEDPTPFACRARGDDDVDHVLSRRLDPALIDEPGALFDDPEPNPFLRYRRLLHSWQIGRSRGLSDDSFRSLVEGLDGAIGALPGEVGFRETPLVVADGLGERLGLEAGCLLVKDETGNVSGSHKARHLMGLALWLEVIARTEGSVSIRDRRLAIASCGNAALGASVVAAAVGRPLDVFVPPDAAGAVVSRMQGLGAEVVACPRRPDVVGDPCFHRLLEAIAGGAIPFTCQGSTNGLTIEGGQTLAWEIVSALRRAGAGLDRLFVQVGGGALATACLRGLEEAVALGALKRMPKIHAVQTENAHPLALAWDRVATRLGAGPELSVAERAKRLSRLPAEVLEKGLREAARHRSEVLRAWPTPPQSVAGGILDDETYDGMAVIGGMIRTGGYPVLAGEGLLAEARDLGRETTGIPVDATGTAGFAGLMRLRREGAVGADERVAVLFTGHDRGPA